MKKLRLLKVYYSDHHSLPKKEDKICPPKDFEFPSNLRYLHWEGLESLSLNFHGENLVVINLKFSNIKKLWKGKKCLEKLKFIDLSHSQQLIKLPKLSSMPNLERLNLEGCTSLCKLHSSISAFPTMKFFKELYLHGTGIKELPSDIGSLTSLEILDLSQCSKFEKFPDIFANMEHLRVLNLCESGIKELPSSIRYLESLEYLNLSYCLNFKKFPEIQGNMKCLKVLLLEKTAIKELPSSIEYLESLESLDLSCCLNFEKFPEIQGSMKHLKRLSLEKTAVKELPTSIGCLEALETLSLNGCIKFEKFPEIQENMENLWELNLGNSAIKELSCSIGHLTRLQHLDLRNCKSLRSLPSSICRLKFLKDCSLNGCSNLEIFSEIMEDMEHLEGLYLRELAITKLPSSIERLKGLKLLELSNCENLDTLPNSIGNLTCLHTLLVNICPKLHKLPDSLRSLQYCLQKLDVGGCNMMEGAIPSDLWCLFSLVSLNVSENNICCIPVGIIQLSKLTRLCMNHCSMLEEIPELPSSLRRIEAHGCPCLETLSSDPTHLLWSSLLNCLKSKTKGWRTFLIHRWNHHHVRPKISATNVIIPGSSGLPKWINHKSMGREITIELPKNWYEDNNFLGFALFCHHVPLNDDDDDDNNNEFPYVIIPQFHLWISHGDQYEQVQTINIFSNCEIYSTNDIAYMGQSLGNGSTSSPDPALRVAYFPQIAISSKYRSNGWNNFKACFKGSFKCGDKTTFKMESCGIHLIYDDTQDHHQQSPWLFNVKRSHDDIEDHPHHKKSRHV